MKTLNKTYLLSSSYILLYFLFAFSFSLFCLFIPKPEGFLFINRFHCRFSDNFFTLITWLGNGLFVIASVVLLILWKKPAWSLQITVSFIVSGLATQILKHLLHSPRPKIFFPSQAIHSLSGVTRTGYTSFPSGHTATIFALTTLLSFYFPGKRWGLFFFLVAALTGFSRIYLSDHFPIDVLGGSFLGVVISMITYQFIPANELDKRFGKSLFDRQSVNLQ